MNFKLILICVLASFTTLQAQNSVNTINLNPSGSITGKVIDKKSGEPLPYVNIVIKENSKVISGGITTEKGNFAIKNLELKNYTVEIQFIGYKAILENVSLTDKESTLNLKTISLEEDATQLSEVEIVKERSTIEQKNRQENH
ncbi:carboxypeptidase-like regulatory domain-containing protein [Flavobacterium soyangense]|uniref:carboxypeptidase-like regulatory domain-containing protein n=1 Tax=Flavobacterium soyangense TaxID=2023265 RepID=UPI00293B9B0A|nr:carboxypeptidase-like regulatory domain-containing protein [Flavobacterium soyangense]